MQTTWSPGVLWLTGLPASGKSTLALAVHERLRAAGVGSVVLDGDALRRGLNRDLGMGAADRRENVRRIGEVARVLVEAGHLVVAAVIAPYRDSRAAVRARLAEGGHVYLECWLRCPLELCERRDPKGLYARARAGLVAEMTGLSAPYEEPEDAELVVDTGRLSVEESVEEVLRLLDRRGLARPGSP